MLNTLDSKIADMLVTSGYWDPFSVLGMHRGVNGSLFIRTIQPQAKKVYVVNDKGEHITEMEKIHSGGIFQAEFGPEAVFFRYKLFIDMQYDSYICDDPYQFMPVLGEEDIYYLSEGTHLNMYEKLGAHIIEHQGTQGVCFAVWAPNAKRVSVVGNFNTWDGRRHLMRPRGSSGIWEIFIPDIKEGEIYKYELLDKNGNLLPLKSDPVGFFAEVRPATASIVYDIHKYDWQDKGYIERRREKNKLTSPISIYEVHLGSWRRKPEEDFRMLTYRELAEELVSYVKEMGYTHVEFLPIAEHPFDGSWGYQVIGMYAPTSRFGTPDDFKYLVDSFHKEDIGVIVDWVPGHFPKDSHGLSNFDGTSLYEHEDPRRGEHKEWGTKIYNFGRNEVNNFLVSNALFWLKEYHIDGLRVDAVASMLYLDYDRKEGEWIPNQYGGRENIEAISFLRRVNEKVFGEDKGFTTVAEESTAWPMVSRPSYLGGLGFGYKWNMGWMHDTLEYMSKDPIYRRYEHDKMTFGLIYAFNENFVLPLSHDEVVHMKGSMIGKMPGDKWQKFANLRAYYGYMYGHPGKKLLFMGGEFAQDREWAYAESLSWHLLKDKYHKGVQRMIKDINLLYKETKALYEVDFEPKGFEWINMNDRDASVFSFIRYGQHKEDFVVVISNFTPVVREKYLLGVPEDCEYEEIFNTDKEIYGGSGKWENQGIKSLGKPWDFKASSIRINLPPLATIILAPRRK